MAFDDEPARRETPSIDEDAIEAAAKLLGKAKAPLIIVGGGAQDASTEVRAIAEMLQAPVVAYRTGLGVLDAGTSSATGCRRPPAVEGRRCGVGHRHTAAAAARLGHR